MTFFNVALNYRSSNQQQNATGVSLAAHEKLIVSLDAALKKLSLTEEEKTEAFIGLTKTKGELESIVNVVSGFLLAIYREEVPPDQYAATFFRLVGDWQTAGVRIDALGTSRNLTPRVTILRKAAQQAHATGDIAGAVRLLDEIDKEERASEQKLLEHQKSSGNSPAPTRSYRHERGANSPRSRQSAPCRRGASDRRADRPSRGRLRKAVRTDAVPA